MITVKQRNLLVLQTNKARVIVSDIRNTLRPISDADTISDALRDIENKLGEIYDEISNLKWR